MFDLTREDVLKTLENYEKIMDKVAEVVDEIGFTDSEFNALESDKTYFGKDTVYVTAYDSHYDCNEIGKAIPCDTSWGQSFENAYTVAINALEEVQKYRELGTPEECKEALEKQTPKQPGLEGDRYADGHLVYNTWICPFCRKQYEIDYEKYDFCPNCGQAIDWSVGNEDTD